MGRQPTGTKAPLSTGIEPRRPVLSLAMEPKDPGKDESHTQTICLLILTAVALGAALLFLKQVLVPFVLALFLTMAVTPVMDLLSRRFRLPRGLAIVTTIALATLFLVFLGTLVSAALADVIEKRETYVTQVDALVADLEKRFRGVLDWVNGLLGEDVPQDSTGQGDGAEHSGGVLRDELGQVRSRFMAAAGGAIGWAVNSTLALMSQGLLVLVFMMFLISGHKPLEDRDSEKFSYQLRSRVREYLRVKILVSAITGILTFAILSLLGVDLALVFGLLAFFLNFIPNIGSAVAVILPLPVILLADPEEVPGLAKLLAVVLPGTVQFLVGNVLEPRWLGKSLDLNPIAILLSLIFWGVLWGPVGMLLSVPITAVIKMLLERSELTQPVAVLLADGD